jgi:8-amino-3,8-dideoxy-alpha-D-manno-octulosonate transaminase
MSGNEIIGKEELSNIVDIFKKSNGVLFAHGFDKRRNKIFRVPIFEKSFAKKLKAKYAVACSSGTAAGAICLKAAGVKPGDEVITQAFTFIAAVESILSIGAIPKIVDVDNSLNMCPKKLKKAITKKTKCIMPVHMLGAPADMREILKISKKYNISVIEDACESTGVKYNNKYLGTLGLSGFFSLDFGKIITTGEGGMITTNSKKQYLQLKALRDHGHENKLGVHRGLDKALVRGFNFRMTEIQAAIGIAQLKKLDYIIKKKKIIKIFF